VSFVFAAAAGTNDSRTIFFTGLISVLGGLLSAYAVYRASANATKTNRESTQSEAQLKWTQQAMSEASQAKSDAQEAKSAAQSAETAARIAVRQAGEATERAIAAEERLTTVESLSRSLMFWIEKIVSAAHDDTIPDQEVRRLINGGPADLSAAQARLRRTYPQD
jgi:hypothetical protein